MHNYIPDKEKCGQSNSKNNNVLLKVIKMFETTPLSRHFRILKNLAQDHREIQSETYFDRKVGQAS